MKPAPHPKLEIKAASSSSNVSHTPKEQTMLYDLPKSLLNIIFTFFSSSDLAKLSSVSKRILFNEALSFEKRAMGFMPGRNEQLNCLIDQLSVAGVMKTQHRILLQPEWQENRFHFLLFLKVRAEILAGRLSLKEVMNQIDTLLPTNLLTSDLRLAKILLEHCDDLQKALLQRKLTLSDLLRNDIHHDIQPYYFHLQGLDVKTIPIQGHPDLQVYQIQGLLRGFTIGEVLSAWFRPVHVEATLSRYFVSRELILGAPEERIIRNILITAYHRQERSAPTLLEDHLEMNAEQ